MTEDELQRLYALIEDGVTDLDEVLKTRLADIKADRDRVRSALDRIKGQSPAAVIASSQAGKGGSVFVRNWRSLGELNPCFSLERAAS